MEYNFKFADRKDVFELHKLVNSAYRGDSSKAGWTTEADLLDGQRTDVEVLAEMLEAPESGILCARDKMTNEILGCVHLKKMNTKCYLGMLTVNPGLQNSGLGKILIEQSQQQALNWSCHAIYMTVISVRSELIAWYERRGFKLTGEKQPFPYGDARFGIPKRQDLEFVVLEKGL